MLTKSATLMPAADLPPSEARGRYRGLLTKSKRAGTRQKRKSKIWRVRSNPNRAQVHARKEKARLGVCGAIPNRAQAHARKEKARFGVCGAPPNRAQVHARKEKARLDVCGAITTGHKYTPKKKKQDLACAEHPQQGTCTRQKRKSKIWRVRSHHRRLPPNYKMKFSVNQLI